MEKSPAYAEKQESIVSDVALAKSLIEDIGQDCRDGKGAMLEAVYRAIHDHLPKNVAAKWTRRRLRGFFGKEAAIVQFREMRELAEVSLAAENERKRLKEARKAHADYINQTAAIAAFLERQDADFHGPSIEGLRGVTSNLDRT